MVSPSFPHTIGWEVVDRLFKTKGKGLANFNLMPVACWVCTAFSQLHHGSRRGQGVFTFVAASLAMCVDDPSRLPSSLHAVKGPHFNDSWSIPPPLCL